MRRTKRLSAFLAAMVLLFPLAACDETTLPADSNDLVFFDTNDEADSHDPPYQESTDPPVTEPPATEPPATEPPVTEPPITEPPVTEPPVTEPPATEPPVTEPPVTEPPATEPPVTEPPESCPMVWIPTNGGKKYHSKSSCSNMIDPRYVTLDEALRLGFTSCKRCH